MLALQGSAMRAATDLFFEYTHNIPVIFSVLERNVFGRVYVDRAENPMTAILEAPGGYLYAAGKPLNADLLDEVLFQQILPSLDEKEIDAFSPNNEWLSALESVFVPRKGVIVPRKIFSLDSAAFASKNDWRARMPAEGEMRVELGRHNPHNLTETWRAQLVMHGIPVSECAAIMVGRGHAELDISTEEEYRGRGYATMTAQALVETLLKEHITPCWSTWPHREASQSVALKVGFTREPDATAWVWFEGMGK